MDNPNFPLMVVNSKTGESVKVLDSQVEKTLADLDANGLCHVYRVSNDVEVIRKGNGYCIRAKVLFGPYDKSKLIAGLLDLDFGMEESWNNH